MLDIKNIKEVILGNKKIIENYFFMTFLQLLNSFFYLLIYPYLIKTLGATNYGIFVYAFSVSSFFIFFINFGFDLLATKEVSVNIGNKQEVEHTLSKVFFAKNYLFIISVVVFILLLLLSSFFRDHKVVFIACFLSTYSVILFPQWYFQAIQKMKIVTFIQLGVKLLSLPFIFLFIRGKGDLDLYAIIVCITTLFGAIAAFSIIRYSHKIRMNWIPMRQIGATCRQGLPFFYSSLASSLKEYSIPLMIGHFFGMRDVAIYDLANKLVMLPRTFFMSVNIAIFPKLITRPTREIVRKVLLIEAAVSIVAIFLIILVGRFLVLFFGGIEMEKAYYLLILLSFTILVWLVVGAYINFVFLPNNKSYLITFNQVVSVITFFVTMALGLLVVKDILVLGGAIALSGVSELIYCHIVTNKYKLLN
ncbi:oligosaccharide flippase family protein [Riemerella anatipestifer]|uniref:oligosaccharide flippase family protein n=1 Tax=Riemerella anatipestifer TaxID=34085 RepID=UPI001374AB95|nr:oligosaccharide flippase family protein [Riemerella anatipestifer]